MMAAMNIDTRQAPMKGELLYRAKLAPFTTWRVGGEAEIIYRPFDADDLAGFIAANQDKTLTVLGAGSNVLIRDGGIKGVVVITAGTMTAISNQGEIFRVEAGVGCPAFATAVRKQQMAGAEFLSGIPGTIGGAIAMNAGAYGAEIWDLVEKIEVLNRQGQISELTKGDIEYGYRYCKLPKDSLVVAAHLRLRRAETDELEQLHENVRVLQKKRSESQPLTQSNCGSVFKNPQGDYAARLIETAGLKGEAIGGAQVSPKHANFIVNNGTATAANIEQLINRVKEQVKQVHGVELESEVRILGEKGAVEKSIVEKSSGESAMKESKQEKGER